MTRIYKSYFRSLNEVSGNTPYDILQKYKNDKSIFITFSSSNKLNIDYNPLSKSTPAGIYSFPLYLAWNWFDHVNKEIELPFITPFEDGRFIYILKKHGRGIDDLSKLSHKDFERDLNLLSDYFKLQNEDVYIIHTNVMIDFQEKIIKFIIDQYPGIKPIDIYKQIEITSIPGSRISVRFKNLKIERVLLPLIKKEFKVEKENSISTLINPFAKTNGAKLWSLMKNLIKSPKEWNHILKNVLNYDYVIDPGYGIIHSAEDTQAVFLSNKGFKIVERLNNLHN